MTPAGHRHIRSYPDRHVRSYADKWACARRYMSAESLAKARMRVIDGGDPLAIDEPATSTKKVG